MTADDHVSRDAGTGEFVTDAFAADHPDTTVRESVNDEWVYTEGEHVSPDDAIVHGHRWRDERDAWIRSFNRLDAAVSHHQKATRESFVEAHDDALYAARARITRDLRMRLGGRRRGARHDGTTQVERARAGLRRTVMSYFIVYPGNHRAGVLTDPPQIVEAETAQEAADRFYGYALVVPCRAFPGSSDPLSAANSKADPSESQALDERRAEAAGEPRLPDGDPDGPPAALTTGPTRYVVLSAQEAAEQERAIRHADDLARARQHADDQSPETG